MTKQIGFDIITLFCSERIWGYSSAGRALDWQSRGQRFDPAYLHQKDLKLRFQVFCFASARKKASGLRGLAVPLFALGVLEAELWQWLLAIGLSAKFLFAGLSEQEGKRWDNIAKNYQRVSRELFGKYAGVKTNLPWIILGGFFAVTLLIRFLGNIIIPVWIAV